jgi:hypothetical protein
MKNLYYNIKDYFDYLFCLSVERNKSDKVIEKCLKKMFKMVGEKYPNEEITSKKEWWKLRSWTKEEEEKFRIFLKKKIRKAYPYMSDKKVELEAGMFILNWGWTTKKTE